MQSSLSEPNVIFGAVSARLSPFSDYYKLRKERRALVQEGPSNMTREPDC